MTDLNIFKKKPKKNSEEEQLMERLNEELTPGHVLPDDVQIQVGNGTLNELVRSAFLSVDRNKWFIVALVALGFAFFQFMEARTAHERYANSERYVWMKMYPNGTWDIEVHQDDHSMPQFFRNTVDGLIKQWVERRFSMKNTISYDYGFSGLFMSPALLKQFTDQVDHGGFDAPTVAAEHEACPNCDQISVEAGTVDHYDWEELVTPNQEGTLYRANVFAKETTRTKEGNLKGEPKNKIISIQWRIRTKKEIQARPRSELKNNPIHLEIVEYRYIDEPTTKTN